MAATPGKTDPARDARLPTQHSRAKAAFTVNVHIETFGLQQATGPIQIRDGSGPA